MNKYALSSVSVAVLLVCVMPAKAEPLSLKLSESVIHDSNYGRNRQSDEEITSSTGIGLGLNKSYGRQVYTANAQYNIEKHKNFQSQDNDNYNVTAGFLSGIASNWTIAINGGASEKLNSIESNPLGQRISKNMATSRDGSMNVQYGVAGRWSLLGSLGASRTSYSLESYQYQNREQNSGGLRLVYNTSDLLSFGFGFSKAGVDYPKQIVAGVPEEVRQRSLDFSSNWQVTGFSRLDAIISYTKNRYKSDPNAGYKGFTGRVAWDYKPSGLTAYSLSASRSTNNDGSGTGLRNNLAGETFYIPETGQLVDGREVNTDLNSVTTSIDGRIRWTPTAKLGFNLGLGWDQYDLNKTSTIGSRPQKTESNYTVASLSGDYAFSRAISAGCSLQHYKQSAESNPLLITTTQRLAHDGRLVSCSASFTID